MKLDLKTLSATIVVLPLVLLAVTSCFASSEGTATATENASRPQTTICNTPPAAIAPDPAFDALLPTLQQMTTAPIMLPASLPSKIKSGDRARSEREPLHDRRG